MAQWLGGEVLRLAIGVSVESDRGYLTPDGTRQIDWLWTRPRLCGLLPTGPVRRRFQPLDPRSLEPARTARACRIRVEAPVGGQLGSCRRHTATVAHLALRTEVPRPGEFASYRTAKRRLPAPRGEPCADREVQTRRAGRVRHFRVAHRFARADPPCGRGATSSELPSIHDTRFRDDSAWQFFLAPQSLRGQNRPTFPSNSVASPSPPKFWHQRFPFPPPPRC